MAPSLPGPSPQGPSPPIVPSRPYGLSTRLSTRLSARFATLLAILAAGVVVLSCGDSSSDPRRVVSRLIAEEPQAIFRIEEIAPRVLHTSFGEEIEEQPAGATRWQPKKGSRRTARGLQPPEGRREVVLVGDLGGRPAESLSLLRIDVRQSGNADVTLSWAGPSESFADERSLQVEAKALPGGELRSYLFALAEHPLWRGPIHRLQLRVHSAQRGARLGLVSVDGFHTEPDPDKLTAAVEEPWKVDLDRDVRSAFVTLPGLEIERAVEVPENGTLHFGYGLHLARRAPVTFRVRIGSGETLFEATLDPAVEGDAERWHHAEVDLGTRAGREITLVLSASAVSARDRIDGFAIWANPEIHGTDRGPKPLNVVLVSIDTLRADRLSLYGHDRQTSPNLDRWAALSAVTFENAIAQAPWTLPSHTSILTGLDALRHGVNHHSPAPPALDLLAEKLRTEGYRTMAITGGGFVHPDYGLGQGFDRFRYWSDIVAATADPSEVEVGVDRALSWLEESTRRPFFLFFHTYEVHHRTMPRQPHFDRLSDLDPETVLRIERPEPSADDGFLRSRRFLHVSRPDGGRLVATPLPAELRQLPYDLYDSGIAFTDEHLAPLFARLEELKLAERTVVVVTSDHGELLGEHGMAGHVYLYEENIRVPLLVAAPGRGEPGRRVEQQVRSVDILPTILELLGLDKAPDIDGRSLVPLLEGEDVEFPDEALTYAASSNRGIGLRVANRLKYFFVNSAWAPIRGEERLFDLRQDPGEMASLEDAERLASLRRHVREIYAGSQTGPRLILTNASAGTYRVGVGGSAVGQANLKTLEIDGSGLVLDPTGETWIEVPPGATSSFSFEDVKTGESSLRISDARGDTLAEIDLAVLEAPLRYAFEGGSWQRQPDGEPRPDTGFEIRWYGRRQLASGPPEETNPELRKQLEALGYL